MVWCLHRQFAHGTSDTERRRANTMTDERSTERAYGGANPVRVTGLSAGLRRLHDLDDYDVAEGNADVRGWEVRTGDGQLLGRVNDLIVSVAELRVRYLDIDAHGGGHALIPIEAAQLDGEHDDVIVNDVTVIRRDYRREPSAGAEAASAAAPTHVGGEQLADDRLEQGWLEREHIQRDRLAREHVDREQPGQDSRERGHERTEQVSAQQTRGEQTRMQEPLATSNAVPSMHADSRELPVGEDGVIRVPVRHEEAVVRKRPVFREEIVIRRRMVTENVPVETEVRRERVDIEGAPDPAGLPRNP